MREILFKGQTKDSEFVYGDLIHRKVWKSEFCVIRVEDNGFDSYTEYEVFSNTVGQYTGLTDKNGNKIFEGDIIAGALSWLEQKKNGVVTFRDGSFGLLWYRGEAEQFNPFTSMCNIVYDVIGNIHDNPELLKGE